jgi:hypothetical protein
MKPLRNSGILSWLARMAATYPQAAANPAHRDDSGLDYFTYSPAFFDRKPRTARYFDRDDWISTE